MSRVIKSTAASFALLESLKLAFEKLGFSVTPAKQFEHYRRMFRSCDYAATMSDNPLAIGVEWDEKLQAYVVLYDKDSTNGMRLYEAVGGASLSTLKVAYAQDAYRVVAEELGGYVHQTEDEDALVTTIMLPS